MFYWCVMRVQLTTATEACDKLRAGYPDDLDAASDVDKTEWGPCYDDDDDDSDDDDVELKFRCSSALGDRTPPRNVHSADILTCEPIQRRSPHYDHDQVYTQKSFRKC